MDRPAKARPLRRGPAPSAARHRNAKAGACGRPWRKNGSWGDEIRGNGWHGKAARTRLPPTKGPTIRCCAPDQAFPALWPDRSTPGWLAIRHGQRGWGGVGGANLPLICPALEGSAQPREGAATLAVSALWQSPPDLDHRACGDVAPARRGGRTLPRPPRRPLTGPGQVQPLGETQRLIVPHKGKQFRDDWVSSVGWQTLDHQGCPATGFVPQLGKLV